jgi:chaperonin GroES
MKEEIQKLQQKTLKRKELRNLLRHRVQNDQVLILPVDTEQEGRVKTPKNYEDKPQWGVVLGFGPGRTLETGALSSVDLKIGDFVLYGQYGSLKVRSEGIDLLFVRMEDIMSIYGG